MEGMTANERTVVIKDEGLRQFEGGFTSIPNRILENSALSLGARMTYGMLLKYAWQKDFCFPAQQQLAKDLGITDRSVRSHLTELREARLVDWKQMGLNRPNVYYILKLPDRVSDNGQPGPEKISAPDRKQASVQDRKPASDKEYSEKNTHTVVNDVTANDQIKSRPIAARRKAIVSEPALRAKYNLTPDQIGRVHWLVQKQTDILGAAERNHAHYVQRAAEAVRDGDADLLDHKLSDFKQAATEIAVGTRPGYFHRMYAEALQQRHVEEMLATNVQHLFHDDRDGGGSDSRSRLIADAERRGIAVPDYIRAADIRAVNRWWVTVTTVAIKPT